VKEARKGKRTRRSRRYRTRPWLVEERRRLYGHYARLMEEQSRRPTVLLLQYGACHV